MRISPHCFVLTGLAGVPPWNGTAGVVTGRDQTLIVDSGIHEAAAATILGYATAVSKTGSMILVNTEGHLDHIGGNAMFHSSEIESYGHPDIRRTDEDLAVFKLEYSQCLQGARLRQAEQAQFFGGTRIENPCSPLTDGQSFDLGCATVSIHFTPGHTPSNVALFVLPDRVCFAGDTVVTGYLPNLECGGPAEWRQWLSAVDVLEGLRAEILVPGHGPIVEGADEIHRELTRIRLILTAAIDTGRAPTDR